MMWLYERPRAERFGWNGVRYVHDDVFTVPTYDKSGAYIGTSDFLPCFWELTDYHRHRIAEREIWKLPDFFEREAALKRHRERYDEMNRIARAEYEQKQAAFRAKKQQEQAQQQATPQEPKQLVLF